MSFSSYINMHTDPKSFYCTEVGDQAATNDSTDTEDEKADKKNSDKTPVTILKDEDIDDKDCTVNTSKETEVHPSPENNNITEISSKEEAESDEAEFEDAKDEEKAEGDDTKSAS